MELADEWLSEASVRVGVHVVTDEFHDGRRVSGLFLLSLAAGAKGRLVRRGVHHQVHFLFGQLRALDADSAAGGAKDQLSSLC